MKWTQRANATGSAAAKPMGGKCPLLLEAGRDWLLARLDEKPDLTLHPLRGELRDRRPRFLRHAMALPETAGDQL